ncbi:MULTISPECIES: DJ-1/PfpI family protein [Myroides]|uniref:DJ-1/PfpI family protein n=1 Tax=Myroides albus TaxID=2562892 RepID=A0A6I3LFT2_9FLAO|nr:MULTISPECIES: DJ-1/PfpI family protein [Myroides]MTG97023.1 DJ-1/PfpI family protein [Myroides albus]MVX35805.1 DJ-1/PfpI family protein [Myroides sp. LoEW2-1]UVD78552.1 DJ-1/PfpI family protein [Myroides albus]
MTTTNRPLNVAFIIFDQVEVLDLNGPLDVFVKANVLKPNSYNHYLVSATKEVVKTEANTTQILPQYSFEDCPTPDVIVLPGANPDIVMNYLQDEYFQNTYTSWIVNQHQQGALLFTVCTGSLLLSNTALFNGLEITTHFMGIEALAQALPKAIVRTGMRYIDQERVLTTAGITAGIDGALYLVSKQLGEDIGQTIKQLFEYKG